MSVTEPSIQSSTAKQKNPVGLAALIVGIVALVFAVIPFLSFIAWLPAIAAIVLGIIGLVQKNRLRTFAWIGLALGVIAWIVAIVVSIASVAGVAGAINDQVESASTDPAATVPSEDATNPSEDDADVEEGGAATRTVTYEVTGDGTSAGNVTYLTVNDGNSGSEQATGAALPFTKEIEIADAGVFTASVFSLVAQAGDGTTISCKITADGEVISEQTSTGQYAVVSCSGSAN